MQHFSPPIIQLAFYTLDRSGRHRCKVSSLGEILANETVGILIGPSLPRTSWMSEIDLDSGVDGELLGSDRF